MPSVAGIAHGATASGCRVMLAGGTQMTAIVAILKNMGKSLKDLCIGTTSYVANDPSSDLRYLLSAIAPQIPILSCELHLNQSSKPGLQAFAKGFVKEGVGAGGTCLATMIKSGGNITGTWLMKAIEKEYENFIEMKHN
jgi:NaMN:DMB phosphoribosyltransferase